MKPTKRDAAMAELIRAIIRLDCQSLPAKFESPSLASARIRPARVASVATIRALLVTFGNLHTNLASICRVTELREYYEFRRPLIDRVLPESLFAFEYCRSTLSLKGATQSPIATKLANLANEVCDCVELIRERISISLEYHELKNIVLGDIQQFASKDGFSQADVGPLMFSLTVSLPLRLEAFAQTASKDFPGVVDQLNKMVSNLTEQAKRRSQTAEHNAQDASQKSPRQNFQDSPVRPKLRPLRGVKYRQPLLGVHQRIPSLQDVELEKAISSSPASKIAGAGADKENPMTIPRKLGPPKPLNKSSGKDKPLRALQDANSVSRTNVHAVPRPNKTTCHTPRTESSRLKQPTRIENRKVAQPVDSPVLRERCSSRALSSRVSRPTLIQPRPSIQELRQPSTSRRSSISSRRWSNASDFSTIPDVCVTPQSSIMALSSPETSLIDETPLSRKSIAAHIPLRQRQSSISLEMPRVRKSLNSRSQS